MITPHADRVDKLTARALEDFDALQEAKPHSKAFYAARRRYNDSLMWLGRAIRISIKENSLDGDRKEFIKRKNLKMLNRRYNHSERKAG